MNQNDEVSGIEHIMENPGDIRIKEAGVYVIIAAPQGGELQAPKNVMLTFG